MTPPPESTIDEIIAAYIQSREAGETVITDELLARHPELAEELKQFLIEQGQMQELVKPIHTEITPQAEEVPFREFGDYQLLEEIARGGMGVVYRTRQKSLNRIVALKMIRSGHQATESDTQRFQAEAESAANLKHPHIVTVYEVGECEGLPYFTMPYIAGKSLATLVAENPLPPEMAVRYVIEIAQAMQYAHQQGILHRDLKPSNILIDGDDNAQVTDFGLATHVNDDSELTRTGQVLGTPSYMPPEQAMGQRKLVGPWSDLYSLGAILYELLTGRPPFKAVNAVETVRQVIETPPLSPRLLIPTLPKDLETICLKCLEKSPPQRYWLRGRIGRGFTSLQTRRTHPCSPSEPHGIHLAVVPTSPPGFHVVGLDLLIAADNFHRRTDSFFSIKFRARAIRKRPKPGSG